MPPWSRVRHRIERELAREQKQLDAARALIEDATRDTVLWLQADPSAVEREHVLAIQAGLADLDRIVERRMERRVSPKDGWEWAEAVADVLSHLEKAKQVRGNIVGKGPARLADHLPRELPGSKPRKPRPQVPEPVRPLSTRSYVYRPDPEPSRVPHDPPIYFPSDLWLQTNVILLKAQREFPLQTQTLELCRYITAKMTLILIEAVKAGNTEASAVLIEGQGGMADLLRLVAMANAGSSSLGGLSNEAYQLYQELKNSHEWLRLSEAIASFAQNSSTTGSVNDKLTAPASNKRQAFVQPILDKKGWSVHQFAVEAEVDFHTANDYLKGKTRPNKSTRAQLAKALGVPVDQLPQ